MERANKRGPRLRPAVRFEREGHLARITLASPRRGNRFSPETAVAFAEACGRCEEDDCWAVLLAAEGADFCRGIEGTFSRWPKVPGVDFVSALAAVTRPVVAAIRGRVEAEGVELALAADLRVVAPGATFSLPQVSRGTLPGFGGTQRLPRWIGAERALRMILLGEKLSGRDAVEVGLATAVAARPEAAAERIASEILDRGPIALRFAKEAVRRAGDLPLDDGARCEHDLYSLLESTVDRDEGIRAFLEKRKPKFQGR